MKQQWWIDMMLNILADLGSPITQETKILDLGCGEGEMVYCLRQRGLQAFGFDVARQSDECLRRCLREGLAKEGEPVFVVSPPGTCDIPFPDGTFGAVVSDQVLEHVMDLSATMLETARVLHPHGVGLHVFPARYRMVEAHVKVPFASVIRNRLWLGLWAMLSVRTQSQKGLDWREVLRRNHHFLKTFTTYRTRPNLRTISKTFFSEVRFVENAYLKHNRGRARILRRLDQICPWVGPVFGNFSTTALFLRK